jgi:hypothetical protein
LTILVFDEETTLKVENKEGETFAASGKIVIGK